MTTAKNNAIKLSFILLLLLYAGIVYADQEKIPFQHLKGIYNDIKAGKLKLLENKEIHIRSEKTGKKLKADVYAITQYRFADIYKALSSPSNWCEFVPLHLNIKSCTFTQGAQPKITFYSGRKFYETPEKTCELNCLFQVIESNPDKFRVQLSAKEGPYETKNYLIMC